MSDPDPAAVAAAERDHAARLWADHQATCGTTRRDLVRVMHYAPRLSDNGYAYAQCEQPGRRRNVTTDRGMVTCKRCRKILGLPALPEGCRDCASLAGHAERTARQAELLAPGARTGEMF